MKICLKLLSILVAILHFMLWHWVRYNRIWHFRDMETFSSPHVVVLSNSSEIWQTLPVTLWVSGHFKFFILSSSIWFSPLCKKQPVFLFWQRANSKYVFGIYINFLIQENCIRFFLLCHLQGVNLTDDQLKYLNFIYCFCDQKRYVVKIPSKLAFFSRN